MGVHLDGGGGGGGKFNSWEKQKRTKEKSPFGRPVRVLQGNSSSAGMILVLGTVVRSRRVLVI